MATLLCRIQIHPHKVSDFEAVMQAMYRQTHAAEPDCLRYEYFRGAAPNHYYCLLSFRDYGAFLNHQVSDYHEGYNFAAMIESLEMEWVDPVGEASPLPATEAAELTGDEGVVMSAAADAYPIAIQAWWQGLRGA